MAWKSDEKLDSWKRRAGTPLVTRVAAAGFLWSAIASYGLDVESGRLTLLAFAFWLLAIVSFVYRVFWRARAHYLDQYRHPLAWSRLTLWMAWWPSNGDTIGERIAAYAALAGTAAALFLFARALAVYL